MTSQPINVMEFEPLARAKMDPGAFDYYASGSEDEVTLRANREAFQEIFLRPHYLVDVSRRDLTTTVLGQRLSFPVMLAPTALQCLAHPDGELATARAAGASGTIMLVSTEATHTLEEIAQVATGPLWFQLYCFKNKRLTEWMVRRVEQAGYRVLCITIDLPVSGRRERDLRNHFIYPSIHEIKNLCGAPEQLSDDELIFDDALTWSDIDRIRSITSLPIVLKGVLTAEDARLAVEHGAAAVIVSNHGGRQLDGAPATIHVLPEIVDAVGGRIEVLLDSGVRRGTDVLKALALGARAVLIGRPFLWGLAAGGEEGVRRVLELLREEFDTALALVGKPSVAEIDRTLIFRPTHVK